MTRVKAKEDTEFHKRQEKIVRNHFKMVDKKYKEHNNEDNDGVEETVERGRANSQE